MKYSFKQLLTLHYRLILCLLIFLQTLALILLFPPNEKAFIQMKTGVMVMPILFFSQISILTITKKA